MSITMGQLATNMVRAANRVEPVSEIKLRTLVQVGVGHMKSEIQAMHAVDTGTMLNSTTADYVARGTYLIGPTVHYAPYVALGTSVHVARPFHISAANKLKRDARDILSASDLGI